MLSSIEERGLYSGDSISSSDDDDDDDDSVPKSCARDKEETSEMHDDVA